MRTKKKSSGKIPEKKSAVPYKSSTVTNAIILLFLVYFFFMEVIIPAYFTHSSEALVLGLGYIQQGRPVLVWFNFTI